MLQTFVDDVVLYSNIYVYCRIGRCGFVIAFSTIYYGLIIYIYMDLHMYSSMNTI